MFNFIKNIFQRKKEAPPEPPRMVITNKGGESVTTLDGNYMYYLVNGKVYFWHSVENMPIGFEPQLMDMHNNCKRVEDEYKKIMEEEYRKITVL